MIARWPGGAVGLGVALAAVIATPVMSGCAARPPDHIEIDVRYSRFEPAKVTVQAGVPVTFVFHNRDPIDHEWIVGDDGVHAHHRTGTEPIHGDRATEVILPALETRTTTVTFDRPGQLQFICHLPAHEAYGMVGTVEVVP